MKRFLALFVLAAMLLGLSACSVVTPQADHSGSYYLYRDSKLCEAAMRLTSNGWRYCPSGESERDGSYKVDGSAILCKTRDGAVYAEGTIADGVLTLTIDGTPHVFYKSGTTLPADTLYFYTVESRCADSVTTHVTAWQEGGSILSLSAEQYPGYGRFEGWYVNGERIATTPICEVVLHGGWMGNEALRPCYEAVFSPIEQLENFVFSSTADACTVRAVRDTSVSTLYLPDCVSEVTEQDLFAECPSLVTLSVPFLGKDRDTALNQPYHYLPASLTSLEIRGGKLADRAFCGTEGLTSVSLGEGVTMGYDAFAECKTLTSLSVSAARVGDAAFWGCTSLGEVRLNEGVRELGDLAFSGCSALRALTLPASLEVIGGGALPVGDGGSLEVTVASPLWVCVLGDSVLHYDFSGYTPEEIGAILTSANGATFYRADIYTE